MRFIAAVLTATAFFIAADIAAAAGCGSRGGPGFRGPNGKCVGWAQLSKVCGNPPTTACAYEGSGVGDTGLEKGRAFIAAGATAIGIGTAASAAPVVAPSQARAFNQRTARAEGLACVSPQIVATLKACAGDRNATSCDAQTNEAVATGDCTKVAKGTEATIQAGSHSFDWIRVRLKGQAREMWTSRSLMLD